jgi:hypothetical protein
MSDFSDYYENMVINHMLRAAAFTPPATVYVALFSAVTGLEANTPSAEIAGTGYARQAITLGAASTGTATHAADVVFPVAGGNWLEATHFAIVDHATNVTWGSNVNVLRSTEVHCRTTDCNGCVMTTRYKVWTNAFDKGLFNPKIVMGVMLVTDQYKPDEADKSIDAKFIIATIPDALTWAEFQANGMSGIIEKLQGKTVDHIGKNQKAVTDTVKVVFDTIKASDKTQEAKAATAKKMEKVQTVMQSLSELKETGEISRKFNDLKDGGVGHYVTYCTELGIICFCESID